MRDRVTIEQLRILDAVVRTGSFSAAAREIGRSQSAVSHAAQTLERVLSISIFDRSEKTPKLTEAGYELYQDAKRIIDNVGVLHARAESINDGIEPELTLAISATMPDSILMESLAEFKTLYPHVPVTLFTEGSFNTEKYLRDGSAKIAIYPVNSSGVGPGLIKEAIATFPTIPVVASDHPLANMPGPLTLEQLDDIDAIRLIPQGVKTQINTKRKWMFTSQNTRLEYLLAGFGWCMMPQHLVDEHLQAGRLVQLCMPDTLESMFTIHVVYLRDTPPGRAGRWLIEDFSRRLAEKFDCL